ncbi:MAG: hypothetical protein V3T77_10510, partial [Planctomycetota bacterium]
MSEAQLPEAPTTQPPASPKSYPARDRIYYMVLLVVLGALLLVLSNALREASQKTAKIQVRMQIQQLVNDLSMPAEALHYDK